MGFSSLVPAVNVLQDRLKENKIQVDLSNCLLSEERSPTFLMATNFEFFLENSLPFWRKKPSAWSLKYIAESPVVRYQIVVEDGGTYSTGHHMADSSSSISPHLCGMLLLS